MLVAQQIALQSLAVPQVGLRRREPLGFRLPGPGRNVESARLPGVVEVVPASHLARDAQRDVTVGVGVAREEVLDVEGVAGDEAMLRDRRCLGPLPVPGPGHGGAGAGGLHDSLAPLLPVLRPAPVRDREGRFDVDVVAGELSRVERRAGRRVECSSCPTHWARR